MAPPGNLGILMWIYNLPINCRGCVSTGATGAMAPVNFEKAYLAPVKILRYVSER